MVWPTEMKPKGGRHERGNEGLESSRPRVWSQPSFSDRASARVVIVCLTWVFFTPWSVRSPGFFFLGLFHFAMHSHVRLTFPSFLNHSVIQWLRFFPHQYHREYWWAFSLFTQLDLPASWGGVQNTLSSCLPTFPGKKATELRSGYFLRWELKSEF